MRLLAIGHRGLLAARSAISPAVSLSWGSWIRAPLRMILPEQRRLGDCRWARRCSAGCGQPPHGWCCASAQPPEELERARRAVAGAIGAHRRRHAAGICEVDAQDGRTLTCCCSATASAGWTTSARRTSLRCASGFECGEGAGRISLLGALSAGQSAEQHRRGGGLDRTAREASPIAVVRGS